MELQRKRLMVDKWQARRFGMKLENCPNSVFKESQWEVLI